MTVIATNDAGTPDLPAQDLITLTIDDVSVSVPKGTLVIRAAELIGVQIPRFCDHPLLEPVGACRQCLVEVEGQRKPLASCTTTVSEGMVVRTQATSPVADKAQTGVLELLLINHPLDCPICDKGGECPLQNQAMSDGPAESRFEGKKREFDKPVPISSQVLLDRERCVLCARCTRFSNQVAGDPFIELLERGALQQVGIYEDDPFESYFSGNTIQICPVGALTSAAYRFRARPFDLVSSPTTCEHCAAGCSLRADHRRGKVMRRLAGDDPEVNEEWNCDKGRFAFRYVTAADRLRTPLVRSDGELREASWPEALIAAAEGLQSAKVGVLPGGRVTAEDAYAYSKFARVVLGTNDIDHRARAHSDEEAQFLAARVAGDGIGVTYADLERAPAVVLVGLEPEEESPILFLRLRKAARKRRLRVYDIAATETPALRRVGGTLLPTVPGTEAQVLDSLRTGGADEISAAAGDALQTEGAILLVGERLAVSPGALSAAIRLADATGARLAWVPRRAGERGAVDAGTLPGLLPGGRSVADAAARVDAAAVWGAEALPETVGRDVSGILAAAAAGDLAALVVGGVEIADLPDPELARTALQRAFVVSLEIAGSEVLDHADVVLPVAAAPEKSGTFVDWEGRPRPFETVLQSDLVPDGRVLALLAAELGVEFGPGSVSALRSELAEFGDWDGGRAPDPTAPASAAADVEPGQVVLASWRQLLDQGVLQRGESALAGTQRDVRARLSAATATAIGVGDGDEVTVTGPNGAITLPAQIVAAADGVVWVPGNSAGSRINAIGAQPGDVVQIGGAS